MRFFPLYGNFNEDDIVDGADYTIRADHYDVTCLDSLVLIPCQRVSSVLLSDD